MAIKVFVSSTYVDLKDHRQRVIAQLRKAGYHVDPMADWTSDADEPKQFSLDRLDGCQACVLLVGFRRGFVPAGRSGASPRWSMITPLPARSMSSRSSWMTGSPAGRTGTTSAAQTRSSSCGESIGAPRRRAVHGRPASVDVLPACARWRDVVYEREQVHLPRLLRTAHGTIRFLGLSTLQDHQDVRIDRLFVEPQVSAQPLSPEGHPETWGGRRPLREAVAGDHRLVILGDPAAASRRWLIGSPGSWPTRIKTRGRPCSAAASPSR